MIGLGPAATVLTALIVVAGAFGLGHSHGADRVQQRWDAARAEQSAAAASASEAARAEEQRRAAAQQEVINAVESKRRRAVADAAAAASAAAGLRERAAQLAATCGAAGDPAAADAGEAAAHAGLVLAELLGRVERAGRAMAAIADARGAAGEACEQAYGSLTAPRP